MTPLEIEKLIAKAMRDIIETAAMDGVITEEEQDLVALASESLVEYRKEMINAFEDGVLTEEERIHLDNVKETIIEKATKLSQEDERISKDELAMIMAYIFAIKLPKVTEGKEAPF